MPDAADAGIHAFTVDIPTAAIDDLDHRLAHTRFGIQHAPDRGPWTLARVARTFDSLMRRLGYDRYGTHGSDWGARVSRELAVLDPPGFLGAHVLQLFSFPSGDPAEFAQLSEDDQAPWRSWGGSSRSAGTTS